MPALPLPSISVCEQARLSRDARFDGLFFTAVRSTGIYCRPICPAPPPLPRNVEYHASAALAEAAGFRPCLRCRPELAPGTGSWRRGNALLQQALALIEQGLLEHHGVTGLATRLGIGERQLRRVFESELGLPPLKVEATRRLLFAKKLLSETDLAITQIALAAGFASLRRFNDAFLRAYGLPPGRLRRDSSRLLSANLSASRAEPSRHALALRLQYRPPYDWPAMLDFLRGRALAGLEQVDADSYSRLLDDDVPAWLCVRRWPDGSPALRLELHGLPPARLYETVQKVRRMFDLDADPAPIAAALSSEPKLSRSLGRHPGLRLPSGWDGFEIAVRAVIGQQISVSAARTVTTRLLQRCSPALPDALRDAGFRHAFPTPGHLLDADLGGLGLSERRQHSLRALAQAVVGGQLDFSPGQALEHFIQRCVALPGVGPWTAHYLALRALGHPDAWPSGDLVLQKALATDGRRASARELDARAEAWRPWRGYAAIHLWRSTAEEPVK